MFVCVCVGGGGGGGGGRGLGGKYKSMQVIRSNDQFWG